MKKLLFVFAIAAFATSYSTNSFAQDEKKEVKTEKKSCSKKKSCCSKKQSCEKKSEEKKK